MKKRVFGRKFSRGRKAREALIKSELRAILSVGKIVTTREKAKAVQGEIDKLLNLSKKKDVSSQRTALSILGNDRKILNLLFAKDAMDFGEKRSGFTKITNLPPRVGDKARIVRLEWAGKIENSEKSKSKKNEKNKIKELTKNKS